MREYVPEAVFNYAVLREQRTYGQSRYPFSATDYVPPVMEDFPGFLEFKRNLLYLVWSHNVNRKHVDMIARAMEKVGRVIGRPSPAFAQPSISQERALARV